MSIATIYSGSIGLNNKIPAHRLPFDNETGVTALEDTIDVLIGRTGDIVTRRGTELLESGLFHSFWPVDGGFYTVKDRDTDSALYKAVVHSDGTVTLYGLWAGLTKGQQLSYTDLDDKTLYCNGTQHGQLDGETRTAWPTSIWTGDETTSELLAAPIGKHIDILSGRVIIAVDDEIFATKYGLPGLVDFTDDRRRFEDRVIMVAAVHSGFFISTEKAVYFVAGTIPKEWKVHQVLKYPAIEYGINYELVDPSFFGFETTQLSVLFATANGPVIGLPTGEAINLIDKNVTLPSGCGMQTGSIMIVDETMILQSGV